jgi:amino acid transporter
MIGGGIYALTGKIAGEAGMYAPFSFALSACLAFLTALSYAELSSRYPVSAGEVKYVSVAFSKKLFASLVGWLIIFTGIISAAALCNATAGFIMEFINLPQKLITVALILSLGFIAIWGISQSVWTITIITLIEIGGLLLVIFSGWDHLTSLNTRWVEIIPPLQMDSMAIWVGIFSATFLAFYAFIGFEDMVNISEEVKNVKHTMPVAIISCISITLIIYCLVITVAVLSVPPAQLAQSNAPMRDIMESTGQSMSPTIMIFISLMATVNGALVQMIMGSRVLYGMAKERKAPLFLKEISSQTRTPIKATMLIVLFILIFAVMLDLTTLARITSLIVLFIFACVNAALLKIKASRKKTKKPKFTVHWGFVLSAFTVCIAMLLFEISRIILSLVYWWPSIAEELGLKSSGFILTQLFL